MKKLSVKTLSVCTGVLLCVALTGTAEAGFQWKAPAPPKPAPVEATPHKGQELLPPPPVMSPVMPMSDAEMAADMMDNMTAGDAAPTSLSAPNVPGDAAAQAKFVDEITWAPSEDDIRWVEGGAEEMVDAQDMMAEEVVEEQPAPVYEGPVIEGFGRDMNIAIGLRQIVPASYRFVFADGVSMNQEITWEGGHAWQAVLHEALRPAGLRASINDRRRVVMVSVNDGGHEAQPAMDYSMDADTGMDGASQKIDMEKAEAIIAREVGVVPVAPAGHPEMVEPPAPRQEEVLSKGPMLTRNKAHGSHGHDHSQGHHDHDAAAKHQTWSARPGDMLRTVLAIWSKRRGVDMFWSMDYDYRLNKPYEFKGSYEEAVSDILQDFKQLRPQPYGSLHRGANGPRVLVIKTRDDAH